VGTETIGACAEAGAELFVAGTAVFATDDYGATIGRLRTLAAERVAA
jgi:ribulose-phosphate 3-epimerase